MKTKVEYTVTVPAGTYFVGDPCYAVPPEDWMPLLEQTNFFDAYHEGKGSPVGEIRGLFVLGFGTKYGDGSYEDQLGHVYGVDAGMIGLTDVRLIDPENNSTAYGGRIVTFERDFEASEDLDSGVLTFGHITIDTDPDEDEEYDCWNCGGYHYDYEGCEEEE